MNLEIRIGGRTHSLEISPQVNAPGPGRGRLHCTLDGRAIEVDAVEVASGVYSILLGGQAFEARVQPTPGALRVYAGGEEFAAEVLDPRVWRGRSGTRHAGLEAEGRQQITAPMPGKVVQVLVKPGERVEAGQGLLVVEAMKMQNEIRAPKTGVVERLLVSEGQAVNAGEVLAIVA